MRITICFFTASCFFAGLVAAPPQEQLNRQRLLSLGKLWVLAGLYHPYLTHKNVDWDGALVRAIPKVRAARDRDEYRAAIAGMLAELGDAATKVMSPDDIKAQPPDELGFASAELLPDGVLLLKTGPTKEDPFETADKLYSRMATAKAVIIDSRAGAAHPWLVNYRRLTAKSLIQPSLRRRIHFGLHSDRGGWEAFTYSAGVTRDGAVLEPVEGAISLPVVFLVNHESQINDRIPALQDAGSGYLVVEAPLTGEALARYHIYPLGEGLDARLRLAEVVHADGTTGLCADRVAPEKALEAALELARHPARGDCRRPSLPSAAQQRPNKKYPEMNYPPLEYRLLAAFRIWGVFEYQFPYRTLMKEDWEQVLRDSLPKFESTHNALEYNLAVSEMVAFVHDTHATVYSPLLAEYWGNALPPVRLRPIEGKAVVTHLLDESARSTGIAVGDVLMSVNSQDTERRIRDLATHIAASTPQALLRDCVARLLSGPDQTTVTLGLTDGSGRHNTAKLIRKKQFAGQENSPTGLDVVTLLPGNIGYVDLTRLIIPQVDEAFDRLRDTKGIIFDMRGYPRDTRYHVAGWLTNRRDIEDSRIVRVLATAPDQVGRIEHVNRYRFDLDSKKHYSRPTVMLIDERAQSQSEMTGMVLRAANGTKFIGTPTVGANGEGVGFFLPGDLYVMLTGLGFWHADGSQLQRVGLIPDIKVAPTIAGIRRGRDEVLQRAISYLNTGR